MTLEEIQRRLPGIHCPICSARQFELKLRCDIDHVPCLEVVKCDHCGQEFDAVQLIKSQEHPPEAA